MKNLALTATLLLALGSAAQAQAPTTGGPTPGGAAPDPTQVPIDGGASLLLASGVAYGLKRLRDRRRA
ncbi:PID-CTERM protein-sorting domain-containing protein [Hymenobacter cheonanensis]|uniref:PID-CTERM protein-sorting domain-containing protein n=1 Tax=Hymenobacter sp. CA2-7 TaxID=3063993 RepID=UPI002712D94E|nr:hypothetical protein [Hymenobacter sp. CA2-7]MDO7884908.1 hypothetical protein [Hymenobacter sp. CA2-7]